MSFFVSKSLEDIITEQDLLADSPIKIINERNKIIIEFSSDDDVNDSFRLESAKLNFEDNLDTVEAIADSESVLKVFEFNKSKINYAIRVNESKYMHNSGIFILKKLEVDKDNYIICKIDIVR